MLIKECPHCTKRISIKEEPENHNAKVRCPYCSNTTRYCDLKDPNVPNVSNHADPKDPNGTIFPHDPDVVRSECNAILVNKANPEETYQLKVGTNIIGRDSPSSKADVRINTGSSHRLSREHAVIDVKTIQGKLSYSFRLYKNEVNPTYVSGEQIAYGDAVRLNPGDVLKLADVTLVFDLADQDKTRLEY